MGRDYDLRSQTYGEQRTALGQDYDMRNQTYGQQNAALGRDYDLRNQTYGQQDAALGRSYDLRNQTYGQENAALGRDYDLRNQTYNTQFAGLNQDRNMGIQDRAVGWGRQLDVAGLYRNMPGASQGAYGLALGAGNNAVGNQMTPGAQYQGAMGQGAGTIQTGTGQQMSGLGSILSAQGAYNNMLAQSNTANSGQFEQMLGTAAGIGLGIWKSDRRLKEDIVFVGYDDTTDLNVYEFTYKDIPGRRFVGVIADEVEPKHPHAVMRDEHGVMHVNYGMLNLEMSEVHRG